MFNGGNAIKLPFWMVKTVPNLKCSWGKWSSTMEFWNTEALFRYIFGFIKTAYSHHSSWSAVAAQQKKSVRWSAFSARASRPATTGFSIVGIPQNGTEHVIQMDDLGVPPWPPRCPHFRKPPNGNRIWCFPATFPVELPEQWWQKVLEISSASNWYNSWESLRFLTRLFLSQFRLEVGSLRSAQHRTCTAGESPMPMPGTLEKLRLDLACIAWHGLRALGHTLGHFLANLLWNHTCHYRSL